MQRCRTGVAGYDGSGASVFLCLERSSPESYVYIYIYMYDVGTQLIRGISYHACLTSFTRSVFSSNTGLQLVLIQLFQVYKGLKGPEGFGGNDAGDYWGL